MPGSPRLCIDARPRCCYLAAGLQRGYAPSQRDDPALSSTSEVARRHLEAVSRIGSRREIGTLAEQAPLIREVVH